MESSTGKKIQEERKRCKMSQEDLAKAIGIKQQTICAYENGKIEPNKNEIVRKTKEEYDRGYRAGREAMKHEIMEHMKKWLEKE